MLPLFAREAPGQRPRGCDDRRRALGPDFNFHQSSCEGFDFSAVNFSRAAFRSLSCSSVTCGYFRSRSRMAVVMTSATTARETHLLSAGTTYHGAHLVLVALSASANAS